MRQMAQMALPGIAAPAADRDPAPLEAPGWVVAVLHDMIDGLLPAADPAWIDKLHAGGFDAGPIMQAAIGGWLLGAGRLQ